MTSKKIADADKGFVDLVDQGVIVTPHIFTKSRDNKPIFQPKECPECHNSHGSFLSDGNKYCNNCGYSYDS
jgi:hypothetical protein